MLHLSLSCALHQINRRGTVCSIFLLNMSVIETARPQLTLLLRDDRHSYDSMKSVYVQLDNALRGSATIVLGNVYPMMVIVTSCRCWCTMICWA